MNRRKAVRRWENNPNAIMVCPYVNDTGTAEEPSTCSNCRHRVPHTISPICFSNCGRRPKNTYCEKQ
jgi:hypothetical protein